jgi:hypothetical protein
MCRTLLKLHLSATVTVFLHFSASAESFLADLDELSDDEGPAGSEGEAMQEDEDGDGLDKVRLHFVNDGSATIALALAAFVL